MKMSRQLLEYLDQSGVRYRVRAHEPSQTSAQCARRAHILPHHLAKTVMLEDEAGYLMAVVPADRKVNIGTLARMLDRHALHLADEARFARVFPDCDPGAVPPVGMAWGIDMVVDDALESSDVVYLEAGDHETLLQLTHEDFLMLMREASHGKISQRTMH